MVFDLHQISVATGHAAIAATHIHKCLPDNLLCPRIGRPTSGRSCAHSTTTVPAHSQTDTICAPFLNTDCPCAFTASMPTGSVATKKRARCPAEFPSDAGGEILERSSSFSKHRFTRNANDETAMQARRGKSLSANGTRRWQQRWPHRRVRCEFPIPLDFFSRSRKAGARVAADRAAVLVIEACGIGGTFHWRSKRA